MAIKSFKSIALVSLLSALSFSVTAKEFTVYEEAVLAKGRGDYKTAFTLLDNCIAQAQCAFVRGLMAYSGEGMQVNKAMALRNFEKAAAQNYENSAFLTGSMYHKGIGTKVDNAKAVRWFKKALEKNDTNAAYAMGWMYRNGTGVTKNYEQSRKMFAIAADAGNTDALYAISALYARGGPGLKEDTTMSLITLSMAARKGHADSKSQLNEILGTAPLYVAARDGVQLKDKPDPQGKVVMGMEQGHELNVLFHSEGQSTALMIDPMNYVYGYVDLADLQPKNPR